MGKKKADTSAKINKNDFKKAKDSIKRRQFFDKKKKTS